MYFLSQKPFDNLDFEIVFISFQLNHTKPYQKLWSQIKNELYFKNRDYQAIIYNVFVCLYLLPSPHNSVMELCHGP
jgi:hypothetical protein